MGQFQFSQFALALGVWHHEVREPQVVVGGVPNRFTNSIPRFVCAPHSPVKLPTDSRQRRTFTRHELSLRQLPDFVPDMSERPPPVGVTDGMIHAGKVELLVNPHGKVQ